jgi:hypothetical protein
VVYAAFSSHCDIGTYHGWLMGYDAKTLKQMTVYNNTPNGNQGSFWEGNAAPAADANANIYMVAGNGTFDYPDGGGDLGESYIKLSSTGGLGVIDYFAPFNFGDLDSNDLDVGSAGVALIGDEAGSASHPHLMVGAGKEGRIYVLDRDDLGKWRNGADSQIVASLAGAIGGLFGNPAYFNKTVYFGGAGDNLKAFALVNATLGTSPSSATGAQFAYPGGVPSVSANGTSNGIVWFLEASNILHAYDASNLGHELYNSNQNRARDGLASYVKFSVPTIANGKVYVGTQNSLAVFGLLAGPTMAVANAAIDHFDLWIGDGADYFACRRISTACNAGGGNGDDWRNQRADFLCQPAADQCAGSFSGVGGQCGGGSEVGFQCRGVEQYYGADGCSGLVSRGQWAGGGVESGWERE